MQRSAIPTPDETFRSEALKAIEYPTRAG